MMTAAHPGAAARPYRRWALALLGALLAVSLGTITTIEDAGGAAPPDTQELTLGGVRAVEQTFSTTRPGLVGVAIRVRSGEAADAELQLPMRLRYANGPPFDIVSLSAPVSAAENGLLAFRFPAPVAPRLPYALTDTLRLIIDVPELPPSTGPIIAVQENGAGRGELLLDGWPQPSLDLVVVPLYRRRWVDVVWPITAMAAGKPGLLGWPPLYVLLPYLYLVALAEGAAALLRARHRVDAG